jgi:hypothetical protein
MLSLSNPAHVVLLRGIQLTYFIQFSRVNCALPQFTLNQNPSRMQNQRFQSLRPKKKSLPNEVLL